MPHIMPIDIWNPTSNTPSTEHTQMDEQQQGEAR